MGDVEPENITEVSESRDQYRTSKSELDSLQISTRALENSRILQEGFFDQALECGPNVGQQGCASFAERLQTLANDGVPVDATPEGVADAVQRARDRFNDAKNDLEKKISDSKIKVRQDLEDFTKVAKDQGLVGTDDLDSNGLLDVDKFDFKNDQANTLGEQTLEKNTKTISNRLKGTLDENYQKFKTWLKENPKKGAALEYAGILAFIAVDIGVSDLTGKATWDSNNKPSDAAKSYSGCYATDNKQNVFRLGMCGYNDANSTGVGCYKCCSTGSVMKDCPDKCSDPVDKIDTSICKATPAGPVCSCDYTTGQCQYPGDISLIPNLVKAGVMNFCTSSGDEYSLSMVPCPATYITCGPTTRPGLDSQGGLCDDTILKSAKDINGNTIDINNLQNYSFTSICVQSNDIFLACNLIAENIDYEDSISSASKTFTYIMFGLAIFLLIITMIWYGILFYRKFKK